MTTNKQRLEIKKAKIWRTGNGYVVSIPKQLVACDVIDPEKPIRVILEQSKAPTQIGKQ